jgi:hypothetical protein
VVSDQLSRCAWLLRGAEDEQQSVAAGMKRAAIIGGVVALVAAVATLNGTGFCYSRLGYLTSEELYEAAISHQADRLRELAEDGSRAIDYVRSHPGCCAVSHGTPFASSLVQDLLGFKIILVHVAYQLSKAEIARAPQEGDFYEAYVEVKPCGGTIHSIGQRLKEMPSVVSR